MTVRLNPFFIISSFCGFATLRLNFVYLSCSRSALLLFIACLCLVGNEVAYIGCLNLVEFFLTVSHCLIVRACGFLCMCQVELILLDSCLCFLVYLVPVNTQATVVCTVMYS